MLRAIQFHDKSCTVAIKIHNVIANDVLTAKSHRISFQKQVPKQTFFFCLVFSEIPGILLQSGISFQGTALQKVCSFSGIERYRPHSSPGPSGHPPPGGGDFSGVFTPGRILQLLDLDGELAHDLVASLALTV